MTEEHVQSPYQKVLDMAAKKLQRDVSENLHHGLYQILLRNSNEGGMVRYAKICDVQRLEGNPNIGEEAFYGMFYETECLSIALDDAIEIRNTWKEFGLRVEPEIVCTVFGTNNVVWSATVDMLDGIDIFSIQANKGL